MHSALICFSIGVVCVNWLPLSLKEVYGLSVILCAGWLVLHGIKRLSGLSLGLKSHASLVLGFLFALYAAQDNLKHRLSDCGTGLVVWLDVRISDNPHTKSGRTVFEVNNLGRTSNTASPDIRCQSLYAQRKIRMYWYDSPVLALGQFWRVKVKLRAPRGFQNNAGFDYEAWMFRSGIDATATVRAGKLIHTAARTESGRFKHFIRSVRQDARHFFSDSDSKPTAMLLALVTGDSQRITQDSWELFRQTGTVHLVVISGLHVGLIAGLGFMFGQVAVRLVPGLLERIPPRWAGVCCSLFVAFAYCSLAGWNVPAQRAFLMLLSMSVVYLFDRKMPGMYCLLLVVFITIIFNPLCVLLPGFWLSFGAVALLLNFFVPRHKKRIFGHFGLILTNFLKVQLVLFIGMIPLMWVWVGNFSWIAPVSNFFAVPVLSWLIVPLSMLSFMLNYFSKKLAEFFKELASDIAEILIQFLTWANQFSIDMHLDYNRTGLMNAPGLYSLILLCAAIYLLFMPLKIHLRLLLCTCLGLPFLGSASGVMPGEFRLRVLDVGQGSANIVETANHSLLFDAGALFKTGFNLGQVVVVPVLNSEGIRYLDTIVLSHADSDHIGGYNYIAEHIPYGRAYFGTPNTLERGERCQAGFHWHWDGVRFEFLHPGALVSSRRNDHSCVLLVSAGEERVLLTGDISKAVERQLADSINSVDVLVVAHHGSKTSSSIEFLEKTKPKFAIVSAGYANQFNHPHPVVVKRLKKYAQNTYVTGEVGAVTWNSARPDNLELAREQVAPYWRVRRGEK